MLSTSGSNYIRYTGQPTMPEEAIAYEAGYRIQTTANVDIDLTAFYNHYDNLSNLKQGTPYVESIFGVAPHGAVPFLNVSTAYGKTYGAEATATWQANEFLRLTAMYSLLQMNLEGSSLVNSNTKSPQQQVSLRAYAQLSDTVQWDNFVYYVDEIQPTSTIQVPAYFRFDTRLAWQAAPGFELTLVGQNLFDDKHAEFSGFAFNNQVQIPRSVYAGAALQF